MSQEKILNILKELGGRATVSEIRKCAKEKYPKDSLHFYVSDRLYKLKKYNLVKQNGKEWRIL